MRFDIITIFPRIFDSYLNESMIKRAREKKLVDIRVHDLRRFSRDKHKKVDDRTYGGGPGMVIKLEPLVRAISSLKLKIKNVPKPPLAAGTPAKGLGEKLKIVLFSATGKQFNAKMAADWAKKYDRIIMIAGHYEGVDERIKKVVLDLVPRPSGRDGGPKGLARFSISDLSVGPYVLTGGELPAMVVLDAVSRHIPGVLGKEESLEEKRHGVGVSVYTRPEIFIWKGKKYAVPKILLSGDHKKIEEWRKLHKKF